MTDNLFCKEGKDGFINWQLGYSLTFCFEIDVSEIKKIIPRSLIPLEVRPGVGILEIAISKFPDGNLGCLPAFNEVSWCIFVHQNLRKRAPNGTKRAAFISAYMLGVAGDNDGFLKHAYLIDKMPIYICKNLVIENTGMKDGNHDALVYDDRGKIANLKWTYPNFPTNRFEKKDYFIQVYIGHEGNLYYLSVLATGKIFIHQKTENAGKLYPHPIFRGLDLSKVSSYCNSQFVAIDFKRYAFYTPEYLSPLGPKDFDPTKDNESEIKEFLVSVKSY